jgi:hypothetical protein
MLYIHIYYKVQEGVEVSDNWIPFALEFHLDVTFSGRIVLIDTITYVYTHRRTTLLIIQCIYTNA